MADEKPKLTVWGVIGLIVVFMFVCQMFWHTFATDAMKQAAFERDVADIKRLRTEREAREEADRRSAAALERLTRPDPK